MAATSAANSALDLDGTMIAPPINLPLPRGYAKSADRPRKYF
jgi:hypothetical protein